MAKARDPGIRRWANSALVRLAMVYTVLFGLAAGAAIVIVYAFAADLIEAQVRGLINADVDWIEDAQRYVGLEAVRSAVARRSGANAFYGALYIMVDNHGTPLAGSLDRWPDNAPRTSRPEEFQIVDSEGRTIDALGATVRLKEGYRVLAVRALSPFEDSLRGVLRLVSAGILLVLGVGLVASIVMTRTFLRRVSQINAVCREVENGNLAIRIAADGRNDEIAATASHINTMLDRIAELLDDVHSLTVRVAHELRTPLTRLRARLEEGERRSTAPAVSHAFSASMAELDEVVGMFEALLELSSTRSSPAAVAEFSRVDLAEVVRDAISLYDAWAEEKDVAIAAETATDRTVLGERELLFRLVANLIENAVKFSPPGGTVRVRLYEKDSWIDLEILDDGSGFPAETDVRRLRPFRRGANAASVPGYGVGLSLVKSIAIRHGGALEIHRRDSGGARVVVRLPAVTSNARPAHAPA